MPEGTLQEKGRDGLSLIQERCGATGPSPLHFAGTHSPETSSPRTREAEAPRLRLRKGSGATLSRFSGSSRTIQKLLVPVYKSCRPKPHAGVCLLFSPAFWCLLPQFPGDPADPIRWDCGGGLDGGAVRARLATLPPSPQAPGPCSPARRWPRPGWPRLGPLGDLQMSLSSN